MLAEPRTDPCDSPSFTRRGAPKQNEKRSGGVRGGAAPPEKFFSSSVGSRRGKQ